MITKLTVCATTLLATSTSRSSSTLVSAFSPLSSHFSIISTTQSATPHSTWTSSSSSLSSANSNHKKYHSFLSSQYQRQQRTTILRKMSSSEETKATPKRVLVPIAEDSEEIETSCITDVLVRFGAEVVVASVKPDGDLVCKMSRGLKIMADVTIEDAAKEEWDLIALPGGLPGANYLRDCPTLITLLKKQQEKKKLYGAVCASPAVVLASHDLVASGATCYPAPPFREVITDSSDDKVVIQDNVVTSQGPGTSLLFALALGEQLYGKEVADNVADALLVKRS